MTYSALSLIALLALVARPDSGVCQVHNNVRVTGALPSFDRRQALAQTIYISSDSAFCGRLTICGYKYFFKPGASTKDSLIAYSYQSCPVRVKNGITKAVIAYKPGDTNATYASDYYEVLNRAGSIAPGEYKTYISLTDTLTGARSDFSLMHDVDSLLEGGSSLRSDVNRSLVPSSGPLAGFGKKLDKVKGYASNKALTNARKKTDKVARRRGLTQVAYEKDGRSYLAFYYRDWFAGRYVASNDKMLPAQLAQEQDILAATNVSKMSVNDLTAHPSLFSQFRKFKKQKEDNEEIKGQIILAGNAATAQDPNSGIDNNYFELRGDVSMPLLGLPFVVEGLYTSQDAHRQIKTSFVHFHYDVEKLKSELSQFIGSYNQKFAETRSRSIGMEQVYEKGISTLEARKKKLESEISDNKPALPGADDLADTAALAGDARDKIKNKTDKALGQKKQAEEKYKQVQELERKIALYRKLLEQNRNTNYFDSAVSYSKTASLDYNNMSYKDMVKKSADLLPDGKAKKLATGITGFDAGMFSSYTSKYTMSGQMLKGASLGYDLGFCEVGFAGGRTDYIGRDGTLDKYTCYSVITGFKVAKNQKASVIYYGYSPERKLYKGDGFFSNIDIAAPTFFEPVHILSINYAGNISDHVNVAAEAASTIKHGGKRTVYNSIDQSGLHFEADGAIPNTSIQLQTSFDKTGKDFENNTLPLALKGTEQYKAGGTVDLLRGFLTLGLDYYHLIQSSLTYSGANTKWGFDVRTHSKRYPSISLTYKPYSTFRTFSDTFSIPQRPMFGSVLTAKTNYQFKKNGNAWRFVLLYTSNTTDADTVKYGNRLLQASCIYTAKLLTVNTAAGYMEQTGITQQLNTTPAVMSFINVSGSYPIRKGCQVSGGTEMGRAGFGLSRYALNGGVSLSAQNKPLALRLNIRAGAYRLTEGENWKELYNGYLEIAYRFKTKAHKSFG